MTTTPLEPDPKLRPGAKLLPGVPPGYGVEPYSDLGYGGTE